MPLSPLSQKHLELILSWRNSPQVRRHMYTQHTISREEHEAWFARLNTNPAASTWIYHTQEGQPAGVVNMTQHQPEHRRAFWGFYTAPDAPKGTGTQMGIEALNRMFNELKLNKLNAEALNTNQGSLRYHEKLGFRQEGHFREQYYNGQDYIDVIRFGLLNSEWQDHLKNHLQPRPKEE